MCRYIAIVIGMLGCVFLLGCSEPSVASQENVREAEGMPTMMEEKAVIDYERRQKVGGGVLR